MSWIVVLALVACTLAAPAQKKPLVKASPPDGYKKVCVFNNKAQYWSSDNAKFFPRDIDPSLCDDLVYLYVGIDPTTFALVPSDSIDQTNNFTRGFYDQVNDLKQNNTDMKTLLNVGGTQVNISIISKMLSTPANRALFIQNALPYLRTWRFDGLVINFEHIGVGASPAGDKALLVTLAQELRTAIDSEAGSKSKLIFSLTIPGLKDYIDVGYDITSLFSQIDHAILLSIEYHSPTQSYTAISAPTRGRSAEIGTQDENKNTQFSVNYLLQNGATAGKIIVAAEAFGTSFTLTDPTKNEIGAASKGPGSPGRWTGAAGFLAYYEICFSFFQEQAVRVWHNEHLSPFSYLDNQWVGYDDTESLSEKADIVKGNSLLGMALYTLDLDDWNGTYCGGTRYPLLRTIISELEKNETTPAPPTTEAPATPTTTPSTPAPPTTTIAGATSTTTTTSAPTTAAVTTEGVSTPNPVCNEVDCVDELTGSLHPMPSNCTYFIECLATEKVYRPCAFGTIFDPARNICNWPNQVPYNPCFECSPMPTIPPQQKIYPKTYIKHGKH